jgi:hypothetical protein
MRSSTSSDSNSPPRVNLRDPSPSRPPDARKEHNTDDEGSKFDLTTESAVSSCHPSKETEDGNDQWRTVENKNGGRASGRLK